MPSCSVFLILTLSFFDIVEMDGMLFSCCWTDSLLIDMDSVVSSSSLSPLSLSDPDWLAFDSIPETN